MLNMYLSLNNNFIAIYLFLIMAVFFDLKSRKVPNLLNLIILIFGLYSTIYCVNFSMFMERIWSVAFIFFIALILYNIDILGAGDLKLFIALSPMLGIENTIKLIGISIAVGGINYILFFLLNKNLVEKFKDFFQNGIKTRMRFTHNILTGYFLCRLFNFFVYNMNI